MELAFDPALPVLTFMHEHNTISLALLLVVAVVWFVIQLKWNLRISKQAQLCAALLWISVAYVIIFLAPRFH